MGRALAGESDAKDGLAFCSGKMAESMQLACDDYFWELRATSIFTVGVSTLLLALLFFCTGKFGWAKYASYVPMCVMEAFLSCVGYKVFKYALKFCKYSPKQFIPAAMVGVPLYFMKAYHIGNPAVVIPCMLGVPLAVFYIIVYGAGLSIDHPDLKPWMFPKMENEDFWHIWTDSFGKYDYINFQAWLTTLPDLLIMLIVCFMDCVLKIVGTEGKLPIKVDRNYEMKLFGLGNILTTLCGSPVGYMQLKFNVINFGIVGNANERRGGIVYGLLCAVTFFWSIYHFNFLPRFFLGVMLFFAGAGFVAENLWGSRRFLNGREWAQIVVILLIFIIFEKLLYAVGAGILLTCLDFVVTYASVRCVAARAIEGQEISVVRRHPLMQANVLHMSSSCLHVVRLKGFVFFASAQALLTELRTKFEGQERDKLPHYQRVKFIVFDCSLFDGMDSSTKKGLRKFALDMRALKITMLWSGISPDLAKQLLQQDIIADEYHWFPCLDEAVQSIEEKLVLHREKMQEHWVKLHPIFQLQQKMATAHAAVEPFQDVFRSNAARAGCIWRYCSKVKVQRATTLLWTPGELGASLYMVHKGAIALYRELPASGSADDWAHPVAVYTQGWFLNREALIGYPARNYAIAIEDGELVAWTGEQLSRITRERPQMAAAIQTAVTKQLMIDGDLKDQHFDQASLYSRNPDSIMLQHADHHNSLFLPDPVSTRLRGLKMAAAMGHACFFGFSETEFLTFDDDDAHHELLLPELPSKIRVDLEIAFQTFKEEKSDEILWEQTGRALLFAGIFVTGLRKPDFTHLSKDQFMKVGHEAAMRRLDSYQCQRIAECWKEQSVHFSASTGHEGDYIPAQKLTAVLESLFQYKTKNKEELLSLADEWEDHCSHGFDQKRLTCFISRLVRLHEPDWALLHGLRQLTGNKDPQQGCKLDIDQLLLNCTEPPSREEAEEMFWTADWRHGGENKGELDIADLLAAIVMPVRGPVSQLPPTPKVLDQLPEKEDIDMAVAHLDHIMLENTEVEELPLSEHPRHDAWRCEATCPVNPEPVTGQPLGAMVRVTAEQCVQTEGKGHIEHSVFKSAAELMLDPMASHPEEADPWLATLVDKSGDFERIVSSSTEGVHDDDDLEHMKKEEQQHQHSLKVQLYFFLEDPTSSMAAQVMWLCMGVFILMSVVLMILQPLVKDISGKEDTQTWFALDAFFTAIFTVEYLLRLGVADALGASRLHFIITPANVCDLLAVCPLYVDLALGAAAEQLRLLRLVRLLRLSRISRIARLAKKNPIFGPVMMVLVVVWFIYMKTEATK
eukprot:TRINITY_DN22504_c0_g1_i1.p1 TRINITY_DN22504_c0_g1~~TRINITY_DN22504_c0_g1_i1.p1  ORF type:complete len:1522 (+),score=333.79 TRINITY_DN22504_c0_g1_i1:666-4568(+)